VDYNHRRERHLAGSVLESLTRPYLLITDSQNAMYEQPKQKDTVRKMIDQIQSALRQDGDVLILTDTAGRVLELLQILEEVWKKGLSVYKLVFLTSCPHQVGVRVELSRR
jgi:cleavage and polyadenylation specificity factor subunit 2